MPRSKGVYILMVESDENRLQGKGLVRKLLQWGPRKASLIQNAIV